MMRHSVLPAVLLAFVVWGAGPATPEPQSTAMSATAMPAGDAVRGAEIYDSSCGGCHSLDANRIGPAHRGVVGRAAASASAYNYSPALKASGITWTPDQLDKWLVNPQALVKGARMGFRLADAQKRADVIAYLTEEGKKKTP